MTDLSVIVPARDAAGLTQLCLGSLLFTLRGFPGQVEVLLLDDASPDPRIGELFADFRAKASHVVRIFRTRERRHYTGVFNLGLRHARGERIFFLSNDMQVTPSFLNTQLAVLGLKVDIASVRGCSEYTDSFPEHRVVPPFPLRGYEDILEFSAYVARYHGLAYTEDRLFSGDAVLLARQAVERLGAFDPRFFGYYSDFDYGLRAQQSGLRLVCARGAWLHHEGAGHVRDESAREQLSWEVVAARRNQLIQADWLKFREKWDPSAPESHRGVTYDFAALRARDVDAFCPFPEDDAIEL